MEGPYPLKIGMKTGLIHTCSDIVVSGGKPLYGLNAMQIDSIEQGVEVSEMVKRQADGVSCPIVGGNTQLENDLKPCISFVVFGELVAKKPIFDSSAIPGNVMVIIGEPLEGEVGERIRIAKEKFATFNEVVKKVNVFAAKDASRGGWFGNLLEMMVKSQTGFKITSVPYPSFGRYMGNYLTCVDAKDLDTVTEIGHKFGCPVVTVGEVTEKKEVVLGKKKLVNEKKFIELIRKTPFKKPYV
jgi:selenophosphate synthetase-related protein